MLRGRAVRPNGRPRTHISGSGCPPQPTAMSTRPRSCRRGRSFHLRRSPCRRQSRRPQSPRPRSQAGLRRRRPITSGISAASRDVRRSRFRRRPRRLRRTPVATKPQAAATELPTTTEVGPIGSAVGGASSTGNAVEGGPALETEDEPTRTRTARPEAGGVAAVPAPAASGSPGRRREAPQAVVAPRAPTSTTTRDPGRPVAVPRPDHRVEAPGASPDLAAGPPASSRRERRPGVDPAVGSAQLVVREPRARERIESPSPPG